MLVSACVLYLHLDRTADLVRTSVDRQVDERAFSFHFGCSLVGSGIEGDAYGYGGGDVGG
jgi:hypothetical protein